MALCVAASLCSCEDRMAEHYAEPDYLQGSISEVLAADGRHTLFLQGVELCDWRRILDGKSILTVMAPDDDAMRAYLTAHYGTDDLTAIDRSEVRKLIGFHILYYPFRKEMLQNFRPKEGDGATEEQKAAALLAVRSRTVIATGGGVLASEKNGALFHKTCKIIHLTRDFDTLYSEISQDPVRQLAYHKSKEELSALLQSRMAAYEHYADLTIANNGEAEKTAEIILHALACKQEERDGISQ